MKITAHLTAILLALIGNNTYAQTNSPDTIPSNTDILFQFNKDAALPTHGAILEGSVNADRSLIGMYIEDSTVFDAFAFSTVKVTFDNLASDASSVRFDTITGLHLEDNNPVVAGVPNLLNTSNSDLTINTSGGFQSNVNDNQLGHIVGFIQPGTKLSAGQLSNSKLIINSSYVASRDALAANNDSTIIGFSTLTAPVGNTDNSDIIINSAVRESDENLKTYSASEIVGIVGQRFDRLSGSILINANATQNGYITGINVNGENAVAPSRQELNLAVTLNHATDFAPEDYHTLIQEDNAGGRKIAYQLENTHVSVNSSSTLVSGIHVSSHELTNTTIDQFSVNITVNASGNDSFGVLIRENDSSFIEHINSTMRINNTYTVNDSNIAALSMDIDQFGEIGSFKSHVQSLGTNSAIGYHFHTDLTTAGVLESGLIYNELDVVVNEPHIFKHTTTDGEEYVSKSGTGILVENRAGTLQEGVEAVLNFVDGAIMESWVGEDVTSSDNSPLGDVIAFDVDRVTLTTEAYIAPPLDPDAEEPTTTRNPYVTLHGDIVSRSGRTDTELIFQNGTYDVTSDFWYLNNASIGDDRTRTTSTVMLAPSSVAQTSDRFPIEDTPDLLRRVSDLSMIDVLDIHVNSATDFSQLIIENQSLASIETLQTINVTLGAELMTTEEFRITLIDGDLLDTMGGSFKVTFEDIDNALAGPGAYALETIVVEYDGVDYVHNAANGWIVPLSGTATDFIIKRVGEHDATIPEPSTATLSLLALAGLLSRRRRRA